MQTQTRPRETSAKSGPATRKSRLSPDFEVAIRRLADVIIDHCALTKDITSTVPPVNFDNTYSTVIKMEDYSEFNNIGNTSFEIGSPFSYYDIDDKRYLSNNSRRADARKSAIVSELMDIERKIPVARAELDRLEQARRKAEFEEERQRDDILYLERRMERCKRALKQL